MPIKFRCNYCRQFLGISRNRAGGVVDCPTCGRTIRVPELDGSVVPVPAPGLNSADEHLGRALDELAALAQVDLVSAPIAQDLDEPDDEIPQPLPEPVPMEIPIPITPAVVALDLPATLAATESGPAADVNVLAELAAASPIEFAPTPTHQAVTTVAPRWLLIAAFAPVLTLVLGLIAGWMLGQFSTRVANETPQAAVAEPAAARATRVRGRISYQTPDGTIAPDIGAAVLLLPATWDAISRLSPAGLRPADSKPDQEFIAAAVRGMHGQLGFTNAQGEFELTPEAAGAFKMVVLSRLSARAESTPIAADDLTALQNYLQDPEDTIGQRSYVIKTVEVRDGAETVWDHQFSATE